MSGLAFSSGAPPPGPGPTMAAAAQALPRFGCRAGAAGGAEGARTPFAAAPGAEAGARRRGGLALGRPGPLFGRGGSALLRARSGTGPVGGERARRGKLGRPPGLPSGRLGGGGGSSAEAALVRREEASSSSSGGGWKLKAESANRTAFGWGRGRCGGP